jgi:hypothetical protein
MDTVCRTLGDSVQTALTAGGVRHECDARLRGALGTLRDTFSSFEISSQAIPILAVILVDPETVDIR